MAKDKKQDNTREREWVWLGDYLDRKTIELSSSHLADRTVGEELDAGLLSISYLDASGKPPEDDLPSGFWRTAIVDRETSAAVQPVISYDRTPTPGELPEGLTYGLTTPLRITNVKVRASKKESAAVPAASHRSRTAQNYRQATAIQVMKEIWPMGPPAEMGNSDVWRRIQRAMTNQHYSAKAIPSLTTVVRARRLIK